MPRKITLQVLAAVVTLTCTTTTADAGCLPPIINPFVWLFGCGNGCNTGCGYGHGCGLAPLFCGTGCGYGYGAGCGYSDCAPAYGGCAPAFGGCVPAYGEAPAASGYNTMGTSNIYTPSWPTASADCGCSTASAMPGQQAYGPAPQHAYAPAPQATAWAPAPGYGYNPAMIQRRMPMTAAAWSPAQQWAPAPAQSAWAPQPSAWSVVPPTRSAALPTAPIYGPWEAAPPMAPRSAGDITGDHESPNAYRTPVNPATYTRGPYGSQIRPVSYGVRPRRPRQYRQSIR